jgi:hypothetical protein
MTGSTHALIVNNTAVSENATCYWPIGLGIENAMLGGTLQGNVIGAVFQSCSGGYNPTHGWAAYICPGYTRATDTNYFQNNISCGDQAAGEKVTHCDPYDSATNVETGDYWADSCPGGNGLASSSLSLSFTSPDNQSFPSGGNGTWSAEVVSNLSIRQVAFFIDGAPSPAVSQEIQDLSTTFASDRMWRYHATLDTTGLPPGSHRISAVATDVSGASQSVGQTFTR